MNIDVLYTVAVWSVPVVLAITLHEAGHAWAAYRRGDSTAKNMGRVSLNPLPHIDPLGTLILPLLLYLISPIVFGWAKPVPVNAHNLYKPRSDMVWVALAGPGANFVMVVIWAVCYQLLSGFEYSALQQGLQKMCLAGIFINLLLGLFNLLPIPPLDGGRVLMSMVPPKYVKKLTFIEGYGIIILVLLFLFAGLGRYIFALLLYLQASILSLVGVVDPATVMHHFFYSQ